jgi:hypothetical protein
MSGCYVLKSHFADTYAGAWPGRASSIYPDRVPFRFAWSWRDESDAQGFADSLADHGPFRVVFCPDFREPKQCAS